MWTICGSVVNFLKNKTLLVTVPLFGLACCGLSSGHRNRSAYKSGKGVSSPEDAMYQYSNLFGWESPRHAKLLGVLLASTVLKVDRPTHPARDDATCSRLSNNATATQIPLHDQN